MGGAVCASLAVTACSSGPPVKASTTPASPFCHDLATFRDQIVALGNGADETLPALQQQVPRVHEQLVKLQAEAPGADTVGGHPVKADLGAVAQVYGDLAAELQNAGTTDPNAVGNALAAVQKKDGAALTDATTRLDAYTKVACHLSVAPTPSSTSTPTSTAVAPVAPSTTANPLSGASTSPVAGSPTTTAPPSTTTSLP